MGWQERFILAAAWDLARHLVTSPPAGGPRVAQATLRGPDLGEQAALERDSLRDLAQQVVVTVLDLTGEELDPEQMERAVLAAARDYLKSGSGLSRALAARLVGEVPRLLDLPRLARLAATGLRAPPALAAVTAPEPEMVVGPSPAFGRVLSDLKKVAATDLPVLLSGESGTGKELLARRLHAISPRADGPFVALSCAALPDTLLESELFGHQKGAFSGAGAPSRGFLRASAGGTLFLDEIGEASLALQTRLLRVLETGEVIPLGDTRPQQVDFRLVCASHRDLAAATAAGEFNAALLYRIMVVPISLPPLRERREDLPLLIEHFLEQACLAAGHTRRLAAVTQEALLGYDWPGNVRQLQHVLHRMVVLAPQYEIGPEQLPAEIAPPGGEGLESYLRRLMAMEGITARRRPLLASLLARHRGAELANRHLRAALGCSDSTAKNILRRLCAAGLVAASGRRGGRRYLVQDP